MSQQYYRASTSTVQPTHLSEFSRMGGLEPLPAQIPESPEVARHALEQQLAQLAEMAQITTEELNNASLHPEVRAARERILNLSEPESVNPNFWTTPEPPVQPEAEVAAQALAGEAATTATIESLSNEGWYEIVVLLGLHMTKRLRPGALQHSKRVVERLQSDYGLGA